MKLKFFFIALCLGLLGIAQAIPSARKPIQVVQPDGSTLTIVVHGDEYLSWTTTTDGYSIAKNKQGFFEYVKQVRNNLPVLSGMRANEPENRNAQENAWLNKTDKHLKGERQNIEQPDDYSGENAKGGAARGTSWKLWASEFSLRPNFKGLLVPLHFNDYPLHSSTATLDSIMNCPNYNSTGENGILLGSVHDYYNDMSQGKFNFRIDTLPAYTATGNRTSYGKYCPNLKSEILTYVKSVLTKEQQAEYDVDGDGEIDHISVIFAGQGQEATGTDGMIWSHHTRVGNISFSCIAEINDWAGNPGIETYCHEFGHALGLPDHYDTDGSANGSANDPNVHDLMSSNTGTGNPVPLSTFSRFSLGWTVLKNITAEDAGSYKLYEMLNSGYGLRINTKTPGEFFILENRTPLDKWLKSGYGHGMLISRIDSAWYFSRKGSNSVNSDSKHLGFSIVPADNSHNSRTISGDCFPGKTKKYTEFSDETIPSSLSLSGERTELPVLNIDENDNVISFNFVKAGSKVIPVTGTVLALDSGWKFQMDAHIMLLGDATCQKKGFCFGTTPQATTADHNIEIAGTDLFYSSNLDLTGIYNPGTAVYVRAYAVDNNGQTVYGSPNRIFTYASVFHTISISQTLLGTVGVVCGYDNIVNGDKLPSGSTLTLTATPKDGYRFQKWMDGNTDNPRTLTLTDDIRIMATFSKAPLANEAQELNVVSAYPNPVKDVLYLASPVLVRSITITDLQGRIIKQLSDIKQTELSVETWQTGTYLIHCQTEQGQQIIKVVKP